MFTRRSNVLLHVWIAIAFCVCVGGCAAPLSTGGGLASVRDAQNAVVIGKSTRADVEAAFGKAVVVSFDSGYEVWVYREKDAAARYAFLNSPAPKEKAEFVLLFDPAGVVKKTRVRMPG
jgi:hypothetical protein